MPCAKTQRLLGWVLSYLATWLVPKLQDILCLSILRLKITLFNVGGILSTRNGIVIAEDGLCSWDYLYLEFGKICLYALTLGNIFWTIMWEVASCLNLSESFSPQQGERNVEYLCVL